MLRPTRPLGHGQPEAGNRDLSGGLSEILVDGKTCFTVPPEDLNEAAAALMMLLQDRASRRAMVAGGRRRVGRAFSPSPTYSATDGDSQ